MDNEFIRSSNEAALNLSYDRPIGSGDNRNAIRLGSRVFSRVSRTILDHLLLMNVRRLCIKEGGLLAGDLELAANDIGKLLGSMGPLEALILENCELRPYLDPCLETPLFSDAIPPASFPPIKRFTIINPTQSLCDNEPYAAAIVKLTGYLLNV